MTEKERILEKLKKVKALADSGDSGEREAANRLLLKLMSRYQISETEIEEEEERTYFIRFANEYERKLLHQLAYKYCGIGHSGGCINPSTRRIRKEVGVICRPSVFIEISADFDFYREALKEEMEVFFHAFIEKNAIFPPPELAREAGNTEIDEDRMYKLLLMAAGIDCVNRRKQLTGKEQQP